MVQLSTLPQHDQDDGFHEIQLNGKQLVFLFMAATVVSVVIFLCGVLVGRGVRAERAASVADSANTAPATVPDPPPPQPKVLPVTGSEGASLPPATGEDLSYFGRLERRAQPAEDLKTASGKPAEKPIEKALEKPQPGHAAKPAAAGLVPAPPASPTPSASVPKSPGGAPGVASTAEPAGDGFTLQVTALKERSEAESVAKRLTSKGYAAYVMKPTDGSVYRVRVGKFKTRQDAEAVAARLEKEEQFKPWITR